jgi:hypothetical protein
MSRINNLTTALAAALLCAAPSLHAVELQSAGSDTKLSVYGFVWGYANYFIDAVNTGEPTGAGSLFYAKDLGSQTPRANNQLQFSTEPTRFGFSSSTPSANLGDVVTKIEYDLNGSNSHLRHASIKFAGWTFGRSFSLWNDGDAGADTVDWAGPVGAVCFDTPRYLQVSYVGNIDKNNSFGISLEQNDGQGDGSENVAGTTTDYKIPTIIAMYTYADSWGHIGVRVMGQNYGGYIPATGSTAKDRYSKMFGAFALSGDIKIAKDDLVWQFYMGKAVGNYGMGIQAAYFDTTNKDIVGLQNLGWMVGYTHNWTDKVRSNLVLSGVTFKSDDKAKVLGADVTDSTNGDAIKNGYSVHVNTFVALTKTLTFGAEYQYEQAKAFGSNNPWTDIDAKGVNKLSNSKIHLALKANF